MPLPEFITVISLLRYDDGTEIILPLIVYQPEISSDDIEGYVIQLLDSRNGGIGLMYPVIYEDTPRFGGIIEILGDYLHVFPPVHMGSCPNGVLEIYT